jgi:hypothetical protein
MRVALVSLQLGQFEVPKGALYSTLTRGCGLSRPLSDRTSRVTFAELKHRAPINRTTCDHDEPFCQSLRRSCAGVPAGYPNLTRDVRRVAAVSLPHSVALKTARAPVQFSTATETKARRPVSSVLRAKSEPVTGPRTLFARLPAAAISGSGGQLALTCGSLPLVSPYPVRLR